MDVSPGKYCWASSDRPNVLVCFSILYTIFIVCHCNLFADTKILKKIGISKQITYNKLQQLARTCNAKLLIRTFVVSKETKAVRRLERPETMPCLS